MLMGGLSGKGVLPTIGGVFANSAAFASETLPANTVEPVTWNRYLVFVANEDGTFRPGGFQPLRLQ